MRRAHLRENLEAFDFELSEEDLDIRLCRIEVYGFLREAAFDHA